MEDDRYIVLTPRASVSWGIPDKPKRTRDGIEIGVRVKIRGCCEGRNRWPLVLTGDAGSGKTCAGLAMLDYYSGIYTTLSDLHQRVCDAKCGRLFNGGGFAVSVGEVWSDWEKANLVVLDEIGIRGDTAAMYETLHKALDSRQGLPLVAISNSTIPELVQTYDDRIASRLSAGTVLLMTGDRRKHTGRA